MSNWKDFPASGSTSDITQRPDMPLYLLKRDDSWIGYDEYVGFVVRAESEEQAREIVSKTNGQEGGKTWLDASKASCDLIDQAGSPGIILDSFNAG
jgi:hypothetical protein